MSNRLFFLFLFCGLWLSPAAQPPVLAGHFPANLETAAAEWTAISADFNQALSPESVHGGTVKVFGRWSGPLAASVQLSEDSLSILVEPQTPFIAGEWVTVTLTKEIRSAGGEPMGRGFSWNFWAASAPGSLQQAPVDTIALRLPGEVYIQTYGAYAGDLNNDGYSDLAVINEASDDVRVLLNDGAGNYADFTVVPMGSLTPSPNEGADFNGDGEIDLAVSTAHSNEVRILFGDGQGGFPQIDVYNTGAGARGLSVLDCNSDGYDDIFITNRISDDITLLSNYGDGAFLVQSLNTDGDGETACAAADANNDGLPDVFVGSYNSQELSLLLGDGQGGFSLSDAISVIGRPWMIAAADLNGDGFADVASANSNGNRLAVAFGDGNGQLSAPVHYANSALLFPLAIDLGDLDGDGDIDIVTSNYSGPTFTVFENDGFGQFTLAATLPAPDKASCAILHDRDNDGDIDITGSDEGADVLVLFENQGAVSARAPGSATQPAFSLAANPCRERCALLIDMPAPEGVTVALFNAQGQLVRFQALGQMNNGRQQVLLDAGQLPEGLYWCRATAGAVQWAGAVLIAD